MDISEQSHAAIASALKEALKRYTSTGEESVLTDIHLHPNQESGELVVLDDDDAVLARTVINEWVNYEGDDFYAETEPLLRAEVAALKEAGVLEKLSLMKPYSFVLIDDEKETVADLLFFIFERRVAERAGRRTGRFLERLVGKVIFFFRCPQMTHKGRNAEIHIHY